MSEYEDWFVAAPPGDWEAGLALHRTIDWPRAGGTPVLDEELRLALRALLDASTLDEGARAALDFVTEIHADECIHGDELSAVVAALVDFREWLSCCDRDRLRAVLLEADALNPHDPPIWNGLPSIETVIAFVDDVASLARSTLDDDLALWSLGVG